MSGRWNKTLEYPCLGTPKTLCMRMTLNEDDDVEWRSRRLQGPGVPCPSVLELYTLLFCVLFHAMVAMETTCSSLENILCTVRSSVCLLNSVIQTVSCTVALLPTCSSVHFTVPPCLCLLPSPRSVELAALSMFALFATTTSCFTSDSVLSRYIPSGIHKRRNRNHLKSQLMRMSEVERCTHAHWWCTKSIH